jgi:hypothetical protein
VPGVDMAEFQFVPPVMLQTNVAVSTFKEASAFMRSFHGAPRLPQVQAGVLRRLETARTQKNSA